jgi:hypothetical protein
LEIVMDGTAKSFDEAVDLLRKKDKQKGKD